MSELFGAKLSHLEPCGAIWSHLSHFGPFFGFLDLLICLNFFSLIFLGFFFVFLGFLSKLLVLLLKVTKGKKSLNQSPPQELGVVPRSGPYLLVFTKLQACWEGCKRRPSPNEAPPRGKIYLFSKMAVTFEPMRGS